MAEIPANPFKVMELQRATMVTVKDGDEKKKVDAAQYQIRYMVGEGTDKRFVDHGDGMHEMDERTIYFAPAIHKMMEEPFHYDAGSVEQISGESETENAKTLSRVPFCGEHEVVEVSFESPGVECCAMTKEEADKHSVPLQFLAGFLLGRSDNTIKVALTKTATDNGVVYYENIHVIPDSAVKAVQCLE